MSVNVTKIIPAVVSVVLTAVPISCAIFMSKSNDIGEMEPTNASNVGQPVDPNVGSDKNSKVDNTKKNGLDKSEEVKLGKSSSDENLDKTESNQTSDKKLVEPNVAPNSDASEKSGNDKNESSDSEIESKTSSNSSSTLNDNEETINNIDERIRNLYEFRSEILAGNHKKRGLKRVRNTDNDNLNILECLNEIIDYRNSEAVISYEKLDDALKMVEDKVQKYNSTKGKITFWWKLSVKDIKKLLGRS